VRTSQETRPRSIADRRASSLTAIEDARRQYVERFGSALVMNTYLKIALVCMCSLRRVSPR
jgi:hypothetical protein